MLARSATIFKWTLYTLAGLVWAVVQAAFLQRVTIWGVIPFLYPLIAALPATFEGPAAGTVYALACGVFCDLLLPSPIPCFYTLILPLVGLAAGLLSQSLIPAGYLCSAAAALPAYLLTGIFHCIVLWTWPSRMGCGHVRHPAGAVRLPAVEPAYDLAVPPGLSPRSC